MVEEASRYKTEREKAMDELQEAKVYLEAESFNKVYSTSCEFFHYSINRTLQNQGDALVEKLRAQVAKLESGADEASNKYKVNISLQQH